ncbi:unnamed protein product, partial [Adineta steineri]
MQSSKEKDETSAPETVLVYHGVSRGDSYLSEQCIVN